MSVVAIDATPGVSAGLVERVRARLVASGSHASALDVTAALRDEGVVLADLGLLEVVRLVRDELVGAGALEPVLRDSAVTDVLVNGPREVWVDRGDGLQPVAVDLTDEASVRRLAQRLAAAAGRRLDDASPYVDARLRDGTRLHAVLPPISPTGTVISLRVPRRVSFSLEDLIERRTVTKAAAQLLVALVSSRTSFIISGGTGSGKTTILSTLLGVVDPRERVLILEDCVELRPAHPHLVRLETRPPNVEGAGAVDLRDLVRQALRMRPDRIIVGEVRGAEVVDLLAALNTGHDGGATTVHANSAADVPARLEALALSAGLSREGLHSQLHAALRVVVHVARDHDGVRRVEGLHVFTADARDRVSVEVAARFPTDGALVKGPAWSSLCDVLTAGVHPGADAVPVACS